MWLNTFRHNTPSPHSSSWHVKGREKERVEKARVDRYRQAPRGSAGMGRLGSGALAPKPFRWWKAPWVVWTDLLFAGGAGTRLLASAGRRQGIPTLQLPVISDRGCPRYIEEGKRLSGRPLTPLYLGQGRIPTQQEDRKVLAG